MIEFRDLSQEAALINNIMPELFESCRGKMSEAEDKNDALFFAIAYSACKANQGIFESEYSVQRKTMKILVKLLDRARNGVIVDEYIKFLKSGRKEFRASKK